MNNFRSSGDVSEVPTNTTATGNAFRDSVCDLLRTRYPNLRVEKREAGTKVDIRFVQHEFGRSETWAVECKDYAEPLTKSYITSQIWPQYHTMQESGSVQRVLIVTRKGISQPDAQDFVDSWKGASHLTYEQLAEHLVGLRAYIEYLSGLKATDAHEYVEARFDDVRGAALAAINQWVADDAAGPSRAVLGSYGQGKSSLARRLASHCASRYLADPAQRMPILLRLGEVVHETQLEGLFGKEFTARHLCPGYQFPTLEHLNRSGRLLIILDGFDEMKHAMTAADFQSNFAQFNRLLQGRAKVLLLGRPNALPSNERELVFRGITRVGDQQVASANFPRWPEWKMAFFAEAETNTLLASCLEVYQQQHEREGRFKYPADFVSTRMDEVLAKVPPELLRRPVHVQLLAGLAADPGFDLSGFNEYRLYEHFIRAMVERDTRDKPARRLIGLEPRLEFQRELAWWAWRRPEGQGYFYRHEVPPAILKDLPDGNAADVDGKRNEYIVSTLTEEKETGVLFFAHRSFQEFLVAERLRMVTPTPVAHTEYSNFMTDDVEAFLRQAPDQKFALQWYMTLQGAAGPITLPYLPFLAGFPNVVQHITEKGPDHIIAVGAQIDPWTVIILHHATRLKTRHALSEQQLWDTMLQLVPTAKSATAVVAALSLFDECAQETKMFVPIAAQLLATVFQRLLLQARDVGGTPGKVTIDKSEADFAMRLVQQIRKVQPSPPSGAKEIELEFDAREFERTCCQALQGGSRKVADGEDPPNPVSLGDISHYAFGVRGEAQSAKSLVRLPASLVYRHLDAELAKAHNAFLRGLFPFSIVTVDHRARGFAYHPATRSKGRK